MIFANCFQGHQNLSRLAPPPNMNPRFEWLPAIPPPNEAMRHLISTKYSLAWDDLGPDNLRVGLDSLRQNLGVQCAVITCFDDQNEYVRAGLGYYKPILRNVSIGAHALLTTEMMVIGDAYKVCHGHSKFQALADHHRTGVSGEILSSSASLIILDSSPQCPYSPRLSMPLAFWLYSILTHETHL